MSTPASRAVRADSTACASLSMAQGPPKMARLPPPTGTPPTSTTVSSRWKLRLASLYFSVMRMTRSTPGSSLTRPSSTMAATPLTPITMLPVPTIVSHWRP